MGKKPSVNRPKGKNVLAKALSGQQQKQQQKEQQERAEQAAKDRAQAAKNKIVQQKTNTSQAKKRKLATTTAGNGNEEEAIEENETEEGRDSREERAVQRKKAFAQPFKRGEKVLLVGEGNFSFAHSLLLPISTETAQSTSSTPPLPLVTPSMLLCTSFDSYKIASDKYPDLESHLEPLKKAGATILFDIDATKLESHKQVMDFCGLGGTKGKGKGKAKETALEEDGAGFDKIVFNFPHVGQGITDQDRNIRTNQTLILDFYLSASHLLRRGKTHLKSDSAPTTHSRLSRSPTPQLDFESELSLHTSLDPLSLPPPPPPKTRGTILLTLRTNPPYSLWLPSHLATKPLLLLPSILPQTSLKGNRAKLQPAYKTVKSWEFEPSWWEGYEHRRTLGWDEKKSFQGNQDIRLSVKERKRLGDTSSVAEDEENVGKKGKKGSEQGKKDKGTGMRTWEFELILKEYNGPARDSGWGGLKRKRDRDREDDEFSD